MCSGSEFLVFCRLAMISYTFGRCVVQNQTDVIKKVATINPLYCRVATKTRECLSDGLTCRPHGAYTQRY